MFLESIKVFGFKSFVGKVEIKFKGGITGILGPNGCGKSNVADAVRWVLGEQSVKQLRGAAMEDVIFKGTRDRKPLGMAEVMLKIKNDNGVIPVDYSEVAIGRRLYRSGVSEYLINKTPCRLKDLRGLFLDSGLGVQAYAIFERLMIDEILNDNSPRRREMFEEASGIMKYKVRKKEALRKLDAANRDLERLNDLITEIEREVRTLSRQVGRARRYRQLKQDTRDLDVVVSLSRVASVVEKEARLTRELNAAMGDETGLSAELRTAEADVERLRLELLDVGDTLTRARQAHVAEKESVQEKRQRQEVLAERREGLTRDMTRLKEELANDERRSESLEADMARSEDALLEQRTATGAQEATLKRAENALRELEERLANHRATISDMQQLTLNLREAESQQRHELARSRVQEEELHRRHERLAEDLAEARHKETILVDKIASRSEDVTESETTRASLSERWQQLDAERRRLVEQVETNTSHSRDVEGRLARVVSRIETLEELKRSYEGYDNCVRRLLQSPPPGVLGALAELLDVDTNVSPAVEAALGSLMQAIVVTDADVAVRCLELLSDEEQGRVTFCPVREMSEHPPSERPSEGRPLTELVRLDQDGARPVFERLLGNVRLVDDARTARAASRTHPAHTWVTPKGDAFHDDRRISGGGATIGRKLLLRQSEIGRLEGERSDLKRELATVATSLGEARERLASLETELDALTVRREEHAAEHAEVAQAVKHLEFELKLTREELRGLESEDEKLADEMREAAERTKTFEAACRDAADMGKAKSEEWDMLAAQDRHLDEERERSLRAVADLRVAFAEQSTELKNAELRMTNLRQDFEEAQRSAAEKRTAIQATEAEIASISTTHSELKESLSGADERIAAALREVEALSRREAECRNAWSERDEALRATRGKVSAVKESVHRVELELSTLRGEAARTEERLFNDYGVKLLNETDADGHPLIVRHERRRRATAPEADAPVESASVEPGTESDPDTNGFGHAADAVAVDAASSEAGEEATNGEDEATDADAFEIVVSDPMPVRVPDKYKKRDESEWPGIVTQLRERLQNFGPVNEMAVEDYETQSERLSFLTGQRDDLVAARNSLMETIRKVNREARERFLATFAQAQENFKQLHEILFPGGFAELSLAGDDPLEADIIMSARPKGKRVESIKLLSSGERALTAIALLFAIYMIKPSPFCILDEVDAPLDDANIDRFVALLRKFSERTQFIVITHNKRTMEACDTLYGVTMEEPGVSKLVSVELHEGTLVVDGTPSEDFVKS